MLTIQASRKRTGTGHALAGNRTNHDRSPAEPQSSPSAARRRHWNRTLSTFPRRKKNQRTGRTNNRVTADTEVTAQGGRQIVFATLALVTRRRNPRAPLIGHQHHCPRPCSHLKHPPGVLLDAAFRNTTPCSTAPNQHASSPASQRGMLMLLLACLL